MDNRLFRLGDHGRYPTSKIRISCVRMTGGQQSDGHEAAEGTKLVTNYADGVTIVSAPFYLRAVSSRLRHRNRYPANSLCPKNTTRYSTLAISGTVKRRLTRFAKNLGLSFNQPIRRMSGIAAIAMKASRFVHHQKNLSAWLIPGNALPHRKTDVQAS